MAPLHPASDDLTPPEATRVFERYARTRDPDDQALLVLRFLPLARHCARRHQAHESIGQVATLALADAVDRYEPSCGSAFSAFAVPAILDDIERSLLGCGLPVRPPRSLQELRATVGKVTAELTGRLGRPPTIDEIAARCETTTEAVLETQLLSPQSLSV